MKYAQKVWKRVLSLTLALILTFGMIPMTDVQENIGYCNCKKIFILVGRTIGDTSKAGL